MRKNGATLDDRDLQIIATLQREGRLSKSDLAKRVNLSSTPCWERLRRLEQAGIIAGYQAMVGLKHFGPLAQVIVSIELESHQADDFDRFESAIEAIPEIYECQAVGGGIDYILKVMARDLDSYQQLIDRALSAKIGIKRYYTYVVTKPIKQGPPPVTLFAPDTGLPST